MTTSAVTEAPRSAPLAVHLYLPPQVSDVRVHLHDGREVAVAEVGVQAIAPQVGPATDPDRDVEAMLRRFESHDPTTRAREAVAALRQLDYKMAAPTRRKASKTSSAYVWAAYAGGARRLSIFVNTLAIEVGVQDPLVRQFVADLAGVTFSGGKGDVARWYFRDGFDQAMAAAAALRDRAAAA